MRNQTPVSDPPAVAGVGGVTAGKAEQTRPGSGIVQVPYLTYLHVDV